MQSGPREILTPFRPIPLDVPEGMKPNEFFNSTENLNDLAHNNGLLASLSEGPLDAVAAVWEFVRTAEEFGVENYMEGETFASYASQLRQLNLPALP